VVRGPDAESANLPPEVAAVVNIINAAEGRWWPTRGAERDFNHALDYFEGLLSRLPPRVAISSQAARQATDTALSIDRWKTIVGITSAELAAPTIDQKKIDRRTVTAVLHCVLWAVHNRLDRLKRAGRLPSSGAELIHMVLDTLASREADAGSGARCG
jgi:hypothetical protein